MVEPKCPSCKAVGTAHVTATSSKAESGNGDAWFEIAHCDQCGYVYGVFPKYVFSPSTRVLGMGGL